MTAVDEWTAQNGEDEIVAAVFARLGRQSGYFVEFGAKDGKQISNTYQLFQSGWEGCLIEGDPEQARALAENFKGSNVATMCAFVTEHGGTKLDNLLDAVDAPEVLDFLSIDIDGDDLAVWRGMTRHRALCVAIEVNPSIPADTYYVNPIGRNHGNSAAAILALANAREMVLIAQTFSNLVFLDADVARGISADVIAPRSTLGFFFGYDGTLIYYDENGPREQEIYEFRWSPMLVLQPIPRALRHWGRRNRAKALYSLFRVLVSFPQEMPTAVRMMRRRLTKARLYHRRYG